MFLLILPILQNSDSIHVYLNVINYECDSIIIWLYNLIPIITIEEVEKYSSELEKFAHAENVGKN